MDEDGGGVDIDIDRPAKREDGFDADLDVDSDDSFEPDEELDLTDAGASLWMVKLPKFLMEKWSAIEDPGVFLGTFRVYNDTKGQPANIAIRLPEESSSPQYDIEGLPRHYKLTMVNQTAENGYVVGSKMKERERNIISTKLAGKVIHECVAAPLMDDNYEALVAARHRTANAPKRGIKRMEDDAVAAQDINMLAAGAAQPANRFATLVKGKPRPTAGANFERAARMPKNELMDLLFKLFEDEPVWSIKDLRLRTRQPEAFLREVLQEIATLSKSGATTNMWSLQEVFKSGAKPEPSTKEEAMDDDDEPGGGDEDEDEDMEEVA